MGLVWGAAGFAFLQNSGRFLRGAKSGSAYGCSVHLAATTGIATVVVSQIKSRIENLNQRRFGLVSVMAFSLPRRLGSYEASL